MFRFPANLPEDQPPAGGVDDAERRQHPKENHAITLQERQVKPLRAKHLVPGHRSEVVVGRDGHEQGAQQQDAKQKQGGRQDFEFCFGFQVQSTSGNPG